MITLNGEDSMSLHDCTQWWSWSLNSSWTNDIRRFVANKKCDTPLIWLDIGIIDSTSTKTLWTTLSSSWKPTQNNLIDAWKQQINLVLCRTEEMNKPVLGLRRLLFRIPMGVDVTISIIVFPVQPTCTMTYSVIFCPTSTPIQAKTTDIHYDLTTTISWFC